MLLKISSNSKLGKGIAGFSIPAVKTCPGSTAHCRKICYATAGFFNFPKIKKNLEDNYQASLEDDFVDKINGQIKRSRSIKAVRIHPAGDFYSNEYIDKWIKIIKANPTLSFWAYTRSWRIPKLLPKLEELSKLPNVQLFASTDIEANDPPDWFRLAHEDKNWDKAEASYVKCPNQKNENIKCADCSYCFKDPTKTKQNVIFKEH